MKKALLLLTLAMLGLTQAVAQEYEYVPFVREGVKWVYFYVNTDDFEQNQFAPHLAHGTVYLNLEFKDDSIINGKTYKAMHKYYGEAINEENDTIPVFMREENKVVYAIVPDGVFYPDCPIGYYAGTGESYDNMQALLQEGQEFVLYDFNDPVAFWDNFFNQHVWYQFNDMITIGMHLAKRYVGGYGADFHMIESIGMDSYVGSYTLCFFRPIMYGALVPFNLSHVIEDGEIIYKGLNYDEGFHDGVDEVAADMAYRRPIETRYYDLMGRCVGTEVPTTPGIYIHQGNRIIVR